MKLTFDEYDELLEKNKKPETNQEKYSKKNLHSFVNKYLELV